MKKTADSVSSPVESLKDRAGGGSKEQVEQLTSVTETLRDRTADAIDRLEKAIRGKEEKKPSEEGPSEPKRSRAKRE